MNHSDIYKLIGAPLKNVRNSWGSVNKAGHPILTVWYDERSKTTARAVKILSGNTEFVKHRAGFSERVNHVNLILAGSPYFMVMATAKDTHSPVRSIIQLDDYLYVGGSPFVDTEGNIFGTYTDKIHWSKI